MATDLTYDWREDQPLAPGETIREILHERGILQGDFAIRMGKSEKFISQLVNGKASLTHETAIDLERVLGVPASFWNAAEAQYRDALARLQSASYAESQAEWAASFPLKDMEERGLIAKEADPQRRVEGLLDYFGVTSVDAYQEYWGSSRRLAARMSTAYTAEVPAIAAWLRAGEIAAEKVVTAPFDEGLFREALVRLRRISRQPVETWQPDIQSVCAAAGVVVVIVRDLPKTRLHGVSWWATKTRAVIELGLRYKTDDQVWFSLYHEAGHLLLDDRGRAGISDLDGDSASEKRADDFAADTLIPPEPYRHFAAGGRPTKSDVVRFSDAIGIAPGIVVGRLQNDGVIPRNWMNDLKLRLEWA